MTQQPQPQKPSRWSQARQAIHDFVSPPNPMERMEDKWGVLKEVGGLRPLFTQNDVEQRRSEIIKMMYELNNLEYKLIENQDKDSVTIEKTQKDFMFNSYKLAKLFQLFFMTGSPWIRGMDNSELSIAVTKFLINYEVCGDIPAAFRMLHSEVMTLLHFSWQGIDVTTGPPVVIQINNVPMQGQGVDMNKVNFGDSSGDANNK